MNRELSLQLLHDMLLVRRSEEAIAQHYPQQQMRCPVHLSIGQEAAAVGICAALTHQDQAVSTHRSHAHYLAKGGDLDALIAELHGKATGCCGGRGGSMHLSDRRVGFLASTAIVGNSIPVGVGMALSQQLKRSQAVTCVFLGDGAVEEGVFYEAANFAAVRGLPVLFACENNRYSVYAGLEKRQPAGRELTALAQAIGLRAYRVDGNDVEAVCQLTQQVVAQMRAGAGPAFIEMPTYRWLEHCGHADDDHLGYRPEGELDAWKARDPLAAMLASIQPDAAWLDTTESALAQRIDLAFQRALAAPYPDPASAFDGIYATPLQEHD